MSLSDWIFTSELCPLHVGALSLLTVTGTPLPLQQQIGLLLTRGVPDQAVGASGSLLSFL